MKNKWVQLLQDCTFVQLFYLWVLLGIGFGSAYYLLSLMPQNALLYFNKPLDHGLFDFFNMVYYSFVTLTSTGYGDIVPLGLSKALSVIEIICGLIVFGFLISKLVSTRQEKIIEQLYDVSFKEKVDKMRTMLHFYRTNISKIIDRVKVTSLVRRSDIIKIESGIEGLNHGVASVKDFLIAENKRSIIKVDEMTLHLLFGSLHSSVNKMIEIIKVFDDKKYVWKKKSLVRSLSNFTNHVKDLKNLYEKEQLKDDLKGSLKHLDESLKHLESLVK